MTRIEIVNQAIEQAGLDSSFQTKARGWLNIITEKLSIRTDYKFYEKTVDTTFVVGQKTYALPADYQRGDTIYYIQNGVTGYAIPIVDSYLFDQYNYGVNGMPSMAYIDQNAGQIVFNSSPTDGTKQFRLRYYQKPDVLSTSNADDAVIPDFKDQYTLIEELIAMAYEYRDDARYGSKKQEAMKSNMDFQRNMYDSDENSEIPLNKFVFRGNRRRGRTSNFGAK